MLFINANLDQDLGRVATLPDGSESVPSLAFQADGDTGLFRRELNTLSVTAGSAERMHVDHQGITVYGNVTAGNTVVGDFGVTTPSLETGIVTSNLVPGASGTLDLGSVDNRWRDLYLSGNSVYLGNAVVSESEGNVVTSGGITSNGTVSATSFVGDGSGLTGVFVPITIANVQITDNTWSLIDDTALTSNVGGYLQVNGTGFAPGSICTIGGTNASATSYVNATTLRVTAPSKPSGTYDVTVVRGDTQSATLPSALTYSEGITWVTGTDLGNVTEGVSFTIPIEATSDSNVTYANVTALPPETTLNSTTGNLEGNITTVANDTLYSFDIKATDLEYQDATRTFLLQYLLAFKITTVVASSSSHSIAVANTPTGTFVYTWGYNVSGQLGDGTTTDRTSPTNITGNGSLSGKTVTLTSGGNNNTFAIASDGTVHAWGFNSNGQLGDGTLTDRYSPVEITGNGSLFGKTVTTVSTGSYHSVALASDGTVHAWGNSNNGQVGDGTTTQRTSPVLISGGSLSGKTVTALLASSLRTFALASDGTVHAWGSNSYGQLGDGTTTRRNSPVLISGGSLSGKTVTEIRTGYNHTVALASDGTVHTWGRNNFGQMGDGTLTDRYSPVEITDNGSLSGKTVTTVSTGGYHTIALASDGTVHAWGYNYYGYLGDGTTTDRSLPVEITNNGSLSGKTLTIISGGGTHTLALASDGSVHAWGDNASGQLGDGTTTNRLLPVEITDEFTPP